MDKFVKANDGKVIGDDDRIIRTWKVHFEEILNTDTVVALIAGIGEEAEESTEGSEQSYRIRTEEAKGVIKLLKEGKAARHDGIKPN